MRRLAASMFALAVIGTGCLGGGENERTVLVDYSHDEFPSFVAKNFPRQVAVHPGTELVFKQTWTGEPHSVTGGTLVNELLEEVRPYIEKSERGEEIPDEPPKKILELEKRVAWSVDHESEDFDFVQTGAQPCYLSSGEPRKDGKPCDEQEQPVFNGRQSFYNSGLIPYAGTQGNEYRVQLANSIRPGSYWFFCNYHGEFQSTEVVVKPTSEDVPTAQEVNQLARKEVAKVTRNFDKIVDDASDDNELAFGPKGETIEIKGNIAGLFDPTADLWHSINAFIPKRLRVRAGEPITWNMVGFHTISFGVPDYFPIFTFEKDGTIKRNSKLDPTAGGAKKFNVSEDERYDEERKEPIRFDAGSYDGDGFWSSGTIDAMPYLEYTMRITKPGTYRFACLIHPPMVGTVEVT